MNLSIIRASIHIYRKAICLFYDSFGVPYKRKKETERF